LKKEEEEVNIREDVKVSPLLEGNKQLKLIKNKKINR
jgi:hypothetical protein